MPRDPVCKMEINRDDAAAESEYKGRTFYFCSEECKESFDKRPEDYMEKGKKAAMK
ncbi:MAG: YHS domain-containing protein [Deltaproteobacteria bacterium]|nr:YHS domain-containing protein [Deltaproteobacteria bacterium]